MRVSSAPLPFVCAVHRALWLAPAGLPTGHGFSGKAPPRPSKPTISGRPSTVYRQSSASSAAAAGSSPSPPTAAMATQPFVIVGGGRVGQALANMGAGQDVVVRRGDAMVGSSSSSGGGGATLPPLGSPIVVCTRNDDLQAVVDVTPEDRRKDLVFIQNGMLQPWLDARGLGSATQVLVYFAVAKLGQAPTDGKTDVNPEGLTAACGPHAAAFAARLHAAGLSCKVLEKPEFTKCMLEKLVWISAFMLVGARYGGCTVGEVEAQHKPEVCQLIAELAAAGSEALGVALDAGVQERLCAYGRSVAHFPTAIKELPWRNGWFHGLSQQAAAQGRADPCPTHTAWLAEVGAI